MRYPLTVAVLVAFQAFAGLAAAQRGETTTAPASSTRDKAQASSSANAGEGEKPSEWRGSIILFDQSATTPTLGLGKSQQSSDQTYEMWIALKPRYVLYESEGKKTTLAVNGWTNLYLELTNSGSTTTEHEPVLGPTFFSLNLSQTLIENNGYKTSFSLGPRLTLPTDRDSRNSGRLGAVGAMGGLSQTIPLAGKGAPAFNSMRLGVSGIYGHPLNRAKTPTNPDIQQNRQDIAGRLISDDQLRNGFNVKDSLSISFSGGMQLAPKVDFGLSYVIQNSWTYTAAPGDIQVQIPTGPAGIGSIDNPTNHRVSTWALLSLDYEALDEMSIGIGYYNLTNQLGPDGTRRNPLWSPEARIFLTATANLDVIFSHFGSSKSATQAASARAPSAPSTQTASTETVSAK